MINRNINTIKPGHKKEIIENRQTGILVSPSANGITTAIRELLYRPSFARQIGINARKSVQKEWNWKNYEKKLIKLYENKGGE